MKNPSGPDRVAVPVPDDHGFRRSGEGFTLVEIIMIIVIAGILAVVATVRSVNLLDMRAGVAAGRLADDLRYAQKEASALNLRTWAVFDASADEYGLYSGADRPGRKLMIHPLTKEEYVVRLNQGEYAGVGITDVDFGGRSEVEFDSMGTPYDARSRRLASDGRVGLTGSVYVVVTRNTGLVRVER